MPGPMAGSDLADVHDVADELLLGPGARLLAGGVLVNQPQRGDLLALEFGVGVAVGASRRLVPVHPSGGGVHRLVARREVSVGGGRLVWPRLAAAPRRIVV